MNFIVATSNKNKVREMTKIFKPFNVYVIPACDVIKDFSLPDETGETFKENAKIKAEYVYNLTKLACIADDSGLEVDALGGAPGVYSARYAGENATDEDRIKKLLKEMEGIRKEKRKAKFVCAIYCILPDNERIVAEGKCFGSISEKMSGSGGFGYDRVFMTSLGKTFAELSQNEKNQVSHRSDALKKFFLKLKDKAKEF